MLLSDFDFDLPPTLIAQKPLEQRDASRMLLLERGSGRYEDHRFAEFPELLRGDELIVVNNVRVIPARLFARRVGTHAEPPGKHGPAEFLRSRIEVLLVRRLAPDRWESLVRPGRKVRVGETLIFEGPANGEGAANGVAEPEGLRAEVTGRGLLGTRQLRFFGVADVNAAINKLGHVPLPPYIRRADEAGDRERYQTVFAKEPAAVAAPTAGLHFTPAILDRVQARGIELREITLDVGLGTFQPMHGDHVEEHQIHSEAYEIPEATAAAIVQAKRENRPMLAVGTTVVRALEDAAAKATAGSSGHEIIPGRATADIFIRPGHGFALVDQLLTNFHLPRSTLLVLVAAFTDRSQVLSAYRHAVAENYRFYSYGDCMLIR